MTQLADNRQTVLTQIRLAEQNANRLADSVKLMAVSKTFPAADIRELYAHGQRDFGENYIQEWYGKTEELGDCPDIVWHVIGNIQSNKTKLVAERAHWVHTLDRIKIAQRLHEQRPAHLPPLQVCIEINIANETAKHGIAPSEMMNLARAVLGYGNLQLRGLMCVAANDPKLAETQFAQMADLLRELQTIVPQADTLSMGMSGDMNVAIAQGATMVRVGSAIFGSRGFQAA